MPTMFVTEQLTWRLASEAIPDDETTVLLAFDSDTGADVEMGWHDEDGWHFAESGGETPLVPRWWADMPEGPK